MSNGTRLKEQADRDLYYRIFPLTLALVVVVLAVIAWLT